MLVTPDENTRVVAYQMYFPNGTVVTPDGRKLIVAESFAARLTAFNIQPDGSLTGRRVWAQLEGVSRGICLDAEEAVQAASPRSSKVLRAREGGEIIQRVMLSAIPIACMFSGPDFRSLFIMTQEQRTVFEESKIGRLGRVETVKVDVPGAGLR